MPVAINVPYALTFVIDHALMATFWLFAYFFGNGGGPGEMGACVVFALVVVALRELMFKHVPYFRQSLPACKTSFVLANHPDYWWDIVQTSAIAVFIGVGGCYLGILSYAFEESLLRTVVKVSMDFGIVNLIKGNTSMRYVHPGCTNERTIGCTSATIQEPRTCRLFLHLDYIFKPNIVHNLHHACQDDPKYMVALPYHYFFFSYKEDVSLYNKIMKTSVDYRLFQ